MAREEKQAEADEAPGAPEWMVTFSDCMTLLLTFFVLLLSFSSFDEKVFLRLQAIYSSNFSAIIPVSRSDRDALWNIPPVRYVAEPEKGSEKETGIPGDADGLMRHTGIVDLHMGLTFVIPSKRVFWGKGTAISAEGRNIMDKIRLFLRETSSRVVISEIGPSDNMSYENLGLPRAWAVMEYITKERNLERDRFSISPTSSLDQKTHGYGRSGATAMESERTVEIVLLERSVHN